METDDAVNKAVERRREGDRGKGYDPNRLAISSYDPKWEKHAHSLPSYRTHATPLQNPDGTFKFMAGLDALGAPATAGEN